MKILQLGLVMILVFVFTQHASSQEKVKQLWYCWEEVVHPQHIEEYFELGKELAELCKSEDAKYSFYAWTTGDFKYQYYHPIESLNDIEDVEKEWSKILNKFGKEKTERWLKTLKSNNSRILTEYADMSIQPDDPRVPRDQAYFMQFQEFYLIPGKGDEFKKIMNKAIDHLKSKGHNDTWRMGSGGLGYEGPVYVGWSFGKDQIDHVEFDKKFSEQHAEYFKELNKEFVKVLRRIEKIDCWFLKDMSYYDEYVE